MSIFFFSKHFFNVKIFTQKNVQYTRGVQKVRGPTKKENEFYDETRWEGCDVIETIPDAPTSQLVLLFCSGCWLCKNVCYFCRTQRRPAGSSDLIHGVIEKYDNGYPWRLVGNTGGRLSSLQECQSEDWALQSWSTEHWRWWWLKMKMSIEEDEDVWRKCGRSGSSGDGWTSMSVQTSQQKCRYYDASAETILF